MWILLHRTCQRSAWTETLLCRTKTGSETTSAPQSLISEWTRHTEEVPSSVIYRWRDKEERTYSSAARREQNQLQPRSSAFPIFFSSQRTSRQWKLIISLQLSLRRDFLSIINSSQHLLFLSTFLLGLLRNRQNKF